MEVGGEPWPSVWIVLVGIVWCVIPALYWMARDDTEVRSNGLYVRVGDWGFKRMPLGDVSEVKAGPFEARDKRWPMRDCGTREHGEAYFLYAKKGVRIVYADGCELLIGSERGEELAEAIRDFIKEKGDE